MKKSNKIQLLEGIWFVTMMVGLLVGFSFL
jgi:hypothetical protein